MVGLPNVESLKLKRYLEEVESDLSDGMIKEIVKKVKRRAAKKNSIREGGDMLSLAQLPLRNFPTMTK